MTASQPMVSVQEWLRLLNLYDGGCIQPVPDPGNPGEVATYTAARRRIAAGSPPSPPRSRRSATGSRRGCSPGCSLTPKPRLNRDHHHRP